ncbi:serine protease SPPA, chloroplastic [Physcomitrium patens]|uniref:Peptidase S49 domain-containing protein n=1 Tax=Physcomitrium patens TaxID=3218 RepID=A0A2K1KUG2_PHYPA|nr:serine protease SPPA, chloroplastic-like [Physcomitrium patens]XP_024371734.1 serine protease SPPA, chloroplastic-like [Physcomitrium patens]XP_024371735.1 serine protease SPPA, chloroplastic-like [Physcomitrium patens]PNR57390.1 hypothetical protein PHYPA_004384 [Physcomitrium patens]|eukprot:XP_024371733.1 serine protease SPPA, chloroplastic-like [Physcomitrella patens]
MATITANTSLQLTRFTSVYKFYDGRHIGTVNARRACCHATRGSPNIRLLTSIKGGSHTSRLMGSGQHDHLVARCSGGDSSEATEMPSDSSDMEADISTINSLESDGKVTQTTVDSAITEALEGKKDDKSSIQQSSNAVATENGASKGVVYPSGDMVYKKKEGWEEFVVKCRMLFTLPWQRVKKGSVLTIKLSGEIAEQYQGRFMQGLSLPQICENLIKGAHDPRIEGVVLSIEPLACGWGKLDEIRRHMEYYKQSGKFLVGYMPVGGEKEYYLASACSELYAPPGAYISLLGLKVQGQFLGGVLEKVGVQPQVQRIGKYKSAGDQLSRKDMSEANREMLTALLDDIYANFLEEVSRAKGKTKEEVEALFESGIYKVSDLKKDRWITDIKYADEIEEMLKERIKAKMDKPLQTVQHRKYCRVQSKTLGLAGGSNRIAIIRAAGNITRTASGRLGVSGEGIVSDSFIERIRFVREAKQFKAVIIRIDSGGGDALASDLMWREIKLLAERKPVIASMADVAASGGYYMAMAAGVVLAEPLTITGSIGVVTAKFNLATLYERVGFAKEIISRGKFAELDADQRPFSPEEENFFKESAMNAYTSFRNKAAESRSMPIEKLEEVAQGRVWTGKAALDRGLVDTLGGISKAVAIAKQKAGIAEDQQVSLVELSRRQASPLSLLLGGASALNFFLQFSQTEIGSKVLESLLKGAPLPGNTSSGVLARMDAISVDGVGTKSAENAGDMRFVSQSIEDSSLWSSLLEIMADFL